MVWCGMEVEMEWGVRYYQLESRRKPAAGIQIENEKRRNGDERKETRTPPSKKDVPRPRSTAHQTPSSEHDEAKQMKWASSEDLS